MFQDATTEIRPRVVMSLDGPPGSGRTRFAVTAPRPIYIIMLDKGGLEGVLSDAEGVKVASYDFTKALRQDDAKVVAREIEDDILQARSEARTVVIDKANYLWEAFRLAEFGKLSKVQARYYESVNVRMGELLRSFVDTDTNILLIHDLADAYEGDTKVGTKRGGYNGVEGIVHHAAMFTKANRTKNIPFSMEVTKCRTNWDLVGSEFQEEQIDFATYASLAVPQVDAGFWS